jgi:hypothetical protein
MKSKSLNLVPDVIFILIVFGMNMLRLNYNENIDQCGLLCRHMWLPLVIAYYIGRFVTKFNIKRAAE